MASRFVVGIDLGTTNTVIAWADTERPGAHVEVLQAEQLVGPGEVAALPLLPSSLYLPGPHELPDGATKLPWGQPADVVGQFARVQGARVPARLVSSAKSWLTHPSVDREGPILPWGAPPEVQRVSPVTASARFLGHLREAWNAKHPAHKLEDQELVLTVPASFDQAARTLTVKAAVEAGLPRFVLLEEPQAAFYDFLSHHGARLAQALDGVRLILVVDVGGGTTDLTLIAAKVVDGQVRLTRIAVGDHLMLGGDNMDMLLARAAEERLSPGKRLDATQWSMLVQGARNAKERLLGRDGPESVPVAVVGRGSKLVGGTLSTPLTRAEVQERIIDGFFPMVPLDAPVQKGQRSAIQELGLPFAADPAVSRHIAAFLRRHAAEIAEALESPAGALPRPDAVLLNGGVFNSAALQARLLEVMQAWFPETPPLKLLPHDDLDLAVARGASWFGRVRRGEGTQIGGGSPRAYYVGIDAGPGAEGAPKSVCVIPRRQEEGVEVALPDRTFALLLQKPVRFTLASSTQDAGHKPGELVTLDEHAQALPPIETVLSAPNGLQGQIPVRLVAKLTEVGTLELFCVSAGEGGAGAKDLRWKLEFQLRGQAHREGATQVQPLPARFAEGREAIDKVYGKKPQPVSPREVKDLFRNLEKVLGPREDWSTALCRELWAELYAGLGRRRRSEDHERIWCQLTGFCLRPGFGHPLDAWRVAEIWKTFQAGLQFHQEKANWAEWWIMWRRVSGGLDEPGQKQLFALLMPYLRPVPAGAKPTKQKGIKFEGPDEMLRLAASLERVAPALKQELGDIVLERLKAGGKGGQLAWSLGRLGARQPLYGSAHTAVGPAVAEAWAEALLALDWSQADGAPFAALSLARVTGDRARDLDPALREKVAAALLAAKSPPRWAQAVREGLEMEQQEQAKVFGESLPAGLKLL